jgi:hypothetical protein
MVVSIGILVLIIAAMVFIGILVLVGTSHRHTSESEDRVLIGLLLGCLLLGIWIAIAGIIPKETTLVLESTHPVQIVNHDDGGSSAVISVDGYIVNVTELLNRHFEAGTKIKRTITTDYSFGIDWVDSGSKFSVVEEDPDNDGRDVRLLP